MEGSDRMDDRTFGGNFSGDSADRLRERVREKLKEFMGDYTDDTLVEYVIVLLKNGRHKEEARNELNVFLGDDTDIFVTWLWDHLSSNLDLYALHQDSYANEIARPKSSSGEQAGRNKSLQVDSESDREKPAKEQRHRRNREWKELVRDIAEPPPLRSSEVEKLQLEEKTAHRKVGRAKRSRSPRPPEQKKRTRQDERQQTKREVTSHPVVDAPRRLLQFAVRDAVGNSRSSSLRAEPALKRLRSVVSTSTGDSSLQNRPQRIKSVASVPSAVTTAIKAAADAAQDVSKVRHSGNVFARLGYGMAVAESTIQSLEHRKSVMEDGEYDDFDQVPAMTGSNYQPKSEYSGRCTGDMTIMERETGMTSDSASDNDGYDDVNIMGRSVLDASQTGTSGVSKGEDSLMVQYSVAKNTDENVRKTRAKDQDTPPPLANNSRKIVNISVNVNTWKPPPYQEPKEVIEVDNRKSVKENEGAAGKPGVHLMKENNRVMVEDGNETLATDTPKQSQKITPSNAGSYPIGRPSEDADSRTIFVSNVHFAATKDALSRHFNKFGEVLKVVILTDAATGLPKGSAYVEFMRREAAELALSLNGTSLMSRILKVVRKGSAHQEPSPIVTWPRIARGSPFASRLARVPFPRGITGGFRARLPIKQGARSLQWKRGGTSTPANMGAVNLQNGAPSSSNTLPSPTARSLTYVRTEPKPITRTDPA